MGPGKEEENRGLSQGQSKIRRTKEKNDPDRHREKPSPWGLKWKGEEEESLGWQVLKEH